MDATSKNVKAAQDAGAPSESKALGPKLQGKTVAEMEAILDADVTAGKAKKLDRSYIGTQRKPMDSWLYNDGTLVRVKPQGSELVAGASEPMYAIEVLKQPGVTEGAQDAVAFKVGADGKPTPKGPKDLKNPYDKGKHKLQYDAYQDEAMKPGHQQAKVDPPPSPSLSPSPSP